MSLFRIIPGNNNFSIEYIKEIISKIYSNERIVNKEAEGLAKIHPNVEFTIVKEYSRYINSSNIINIYK